MSASTSREKSVFYAALDITAPAERHAFLEQACDGDDELRTAVEELLALDADSDSDRFFDDCASSLAMAPADELASPEASATDRCEPLFEEKPGASIGRYKVLRKIGEGGCGLVFLAEQDEPVRRRVALKVIKLGMDTKGVIARFEAERQALAMMAHPNIARVLDAGATDAGRPYFVMELVDGVRLTEYCDQNRLGMEQRLKLFVQICHAIQHAHQKGIIHRDIKPSNVLVTMLDGVPVPKVIDFGIAKATDEPLTEKTLLTAYAQPMGTPAYMSPEQVQLGGADLDTRSDIYSLGVLLYELLTGRTPFDSKELLKAGVDGMRRTLRECEPVRPSAKLRSLAADELTKTAALRRIEGHRLLSELQGDLDWITLKALEKDRARRYETAYGLAMDIQRQLNHEPVVARPPSNWYRLQKLVRRNRVTFVAGSAVVAALFIATVTSTRLFIKEREARAMEARLRHEAERKERASLVALLVTQQKFVEADALLHNIALDKPSIEAAAELRALGDWHAVDGRWGPAAERFWLATGVDQLDAPDIVAADHLKLGAALLESGDLQGYEHFRQTAVDRFTVAEHPGAEWVIKAALLLPADPKMIEALEAQGELAQNSFQPEELETAHPAREAIRAATMALLEYRRGNYATATGWCQRSLANPVYHPATNAGARLIWALACWHLGDKSQALIQWSLGKELVDARSALGLDRGDALEGFWFDWVIARILMRECDQRFAEAERSFVPSSVAEPSANDLLMMRVLGDWRALHQDWRGAEARFHALLEMNQRDWWGNVMVDYLCQGVVSVEQGHAAHYERAREELVRRFKGTDHKMVAERSLYIALLLPANDDLLAALKPMADLAANPSARSVGNDWNANMFPAWSAQSLALFEYRRSKYDKAVELSRRCLAYPDCLPVPGNTARVILAMSLHQLGNHAAARTELRAAQAGIENGIKARLNQYNWRDWVYARILLREAVRQQGDPATPKPLRTE
jgi:eukaryotic-like serine/threonine-protein kinase